MVAHASADDAKRSQADPAAARPVMVGGNGPDVTWRLAARFGDELNLDGMSPDEVADALPVIRSRCEEIGRDPDSLRVSVHVWWEQSRDEGSARIDKLAGFRDAGVHRVQTQIRAAATDDEALDRFAEDVRAAGATLDPAG